MDDITLLKALRSHFQDTKVPKELLVMLYKTAHRRWNAFCIEHINNVKIVNENGITTLRAVPCITAGLADEFIQKNIEWIKSSVEKRVMHIMWPDDHPLEDDIDEKAIA